jgi:hypothetical protein
MDFDDNKAATSSSNLKPCVESLISILDVALRTYGDTELDATVSPLLTLLKRIAKVAPPPVIAVMKALLLPDPPTKGVISKDPALLHVRLMEYLTNPRSTALYDGISSLFFELSGGDIQKLTGELGLGFSSGFMMTRNMQIPRKNSSVRSSVTSVSTESARSVDLSTVRTKPLLSTPMKGGKFAKKRPGMQGEGKLMMLFDRYVSRASRDF